MARNEEKALTLFSKWQTFKKDFHADKNNRRPLLDSECESLGDAEKFRRDILSNLTKKLSAIRNAGLGEPRIRELNDEINKLLRQKHFWEKKIRELGGTVPTGKQFYDIDGKELPGAPGYKYYGAAKELPGIRELFAAHEEQDQAQRLRNANKRTRAELYKHVTPDYYGFRDDDGEEAVIVLPDEDGPPSKQPQYQSLVELEAKRERDLLKAVPRYVASSAESDEENEQLAALAPFAK
eukprot:gene14128-10090_t